MAAEKKRKREKEEEKKSMIIVVPSSDRLTAWSSSLGPKWKHWKRTGTIPRVKGEVTSNERASTERKPTKRLVRNVRNREKTRTQRNITYLKEQMMVKKEESKVGGKGAPHGHNN
jgi:hypothetical protein